LGIYSPYPWIDIAQKPAHFGKIIGRTMSSGPDSICFIYEKTLLRIADVKRSTWQNWTRAEILEATPDGRYKEAHLVEVGLVAPLVAVLNNLEDVRTAWRPERDGILQRLLASRPTRAIYAADRAKVASTGARAPSDVGTGRAAA
jgi:hypothetical protein